MLLARILALVASVLPLVISLPAFALVVADHTSIDDRDPFPLPYPTTLSTYDVYLAWQNELHWDTSRITLSNNQTVARSPSDGQNTLIAGYKPCDGFAFVLQTTLAFRNESFQAHGQFELVHADRDFPLDLSVGGGLGYSVKGSLLPELQFVLGHTFKPPVRKMKSGKLIPGRGVTLAPQFLTGLRILGQAFSSAAVDGDPNSPYAGATSRRLVYDAVVFLEAEWKGFTARMGAGWENLVQTYNVREDTPGANFGVQNGPLLFFTLGASFSTENI